MFKNSWLHLRRQMFSHQTPFSCGRLLIQSPSQGSPSNLERPTHRFHLHLIQNHRVFKYETRRGIHQRRSLDSLGQTANCQTVQTRAGSSRSRTSRLLAKSHSTNAQRILLSGEKISPYRIPGNDREVECTHCTRHLAD